MSLLEQPSSRSKQSPRNVRNNRPSSASPDSLLPPGGFDLSLFIDSSFIQQACSLQSQSIHLFCMYCKKICRKPLEFTGGCHHSICESCMTPMLETRDVCSAADCNTPVRGLSAHSSNVIDAMIGRQTIYCPWREHGCPHNTIIGRQCSTMNEHLSKCEARPVRCDRCQSLVTSTHLTRHNNDECSMRLIRCDLCSESIRADMMVSHRSPGSPLCENIHKCPNQCLLPRFMFDRSNGSSNGSSGKRKRTETVDPFDAGISNDETSHFTMLPRSHLPNHLLICPNVMLACGVCSQSITRASFMSHFAEHHPDKPVVVERSSVPVFDQPVITQSASPKSDNQMICTYKQQIESMTQHAGMTMKQLLDAQRSTAHLQEERDKLQGQLNDVIRKNASEPEKQQFLSEINELVTHNSSLMSALEQIQQYNTALLEVISPSHPIHIQVINANEHLSQLQRKQQHFLQRDQQKQQQLLAQQQLFQNPFLTSSFQSHSQQHQPFTFGQPSQQPSVAMQLPSDGPVQGQSILTSSSPVPGQSMLTSSSAAPSRADFEQALAVLPCLYCKIPRSQLVIPGVPNPCTTYHLHDRSVIDPVHRCCNQLPGKPGCQVHEKHEFDFTEIEKRFADKSLWLQECHPVRVRDLATVKLQHARLVNQAHDTEMSM